MAGGERREGMWEWAATVVWSSPQCFAQTKGVWYSGPIFRHRRVFVARRLVLGQNGSLALSHADAIFCHSRKLPHLHKTSVAQQCAR